LLLLRHAVLQPGQAVFMPAGGLRAYLHGTGIEVARLPRQPRSGIMTILCRTGERSSAPATPESRCAQITQL
jgi:hypothetical protein